MSYFAGRNSPGKRGNKRQRLARKRNRTGRFRRSTVRLKFGKGVRRSRRK